MTPVGTPEPNGYDPFREAVQVFRDGWLAVCVYRNDHHGRTYHDSVIFRRIRMTGRFGWVRGTNLKHEDLRQLIPLLSAASEWIGQCGVEPVGSND